MLPNLKINLISVVGNPSFPNYSMNKIFAQEIKHRTTHTLNFKILKVDNVHTINVKNNPIIHHNGGFVILFLSITLEPLDCFSLRH